MLSEENLKIKVFDLTGRLILNQFGDKSQTLSTLKSFSISSSNSVYIIEIEDSDNNIHRSKIFLKRE